MLEPETIDLPMCETCDLDIRAQCTRPLTLMRITSGITKDSDMHRQTVGDVALNVEKRLGRLGCGFTSKALKQLFTQET